MHVNTWRPPPKTLMADPKLLTSSKPRNAVVDWTMRIGVAMFYFTFGLEKFSRAESHWVELFQHIGAGVWFRYFTGAVEILGGFLVLIPRTTLIGLVLLSATMAAAALILTFVLDRPADGVFPAIFLVALLVIGWNMREAGKKHLASGSKCV
jgi:putative oxidoreductase